MAEEPHTPAAQTPAQASDTQAPDDNSPLSEMLAQEPSRITRRFLYALLISLAGAVVTASVLHVDVTVTAPATLIPEGKALPIQTDLPGTVVEVKVREGTRVARGDILAVLESEKAGEQLFNLREASLKWKNADHALRVVLPIERKKIRDEIQSLEEEIAHLGRDRKLLLEKKQHEESAFKLTGEAYAELKRKLDEAQRRLAGDVKVADELLTFRIRQLDARTRLFKLQAVSELELLSARREEDEARTGTETVRSKMREAGNDRILAQKNYLRAAETHQKALAEINQDLGKNAFQASSARSKILKLQSDEKLKELEATTNERTAWFEYDLARKKAELPRNPLDRQTVSAVDSGAAVVGRILVIAPVAGRIGTVKVLRRGEAFERGQTMMTLLPDGPLVAEIRVPNKDVGLVKAGQPVKLKLDAFPFAEYGSVRGQLVNVPPDAEGTETPDSSFYRATARLDDQSVRKNGETVALLSGMTATAEIITDRKTVLGLILTPLLEPFQK
jgi:HlyD family secretion protein